MDDREQALETPLRSAAVVLLVLVQVLLVACHFPPVASIPLTLDDDNQLYLSARINGVNFMCVLDSGAGDRIYLNRDRAIAAGIRPTSHGPTGWVHSEMLAGDARAKATLEVGGLQLGDRERAMQHRPRGRVCVLRLRTLRQFMRE